MENLMDIYPKTSNVNNLRFEHNGKVLLLHHSNADLEIGDRIKASGSISGSQVTAGDAAAGYSYGWDIADIQAVKDAANNQAKARTIYLTSSNLEDTLPDINLPGSSARAVRGDLPILDKITIPANVEFGGRDARAMIYEMIDRHGVKLGTKEEGNLVNIAYLVAKGEEATKGYAAGRAELRAIALGDKIEEYTKALNDPESILPRVPYQKEYFDESIKLYNEQGIEGLKRSAIERIKDSPIFASGHSQVQEILEKTEASKYIGQHITEIPKETLRKGILKGSISGIPFDVLEDDFEKITRNIEANRAAKVSSGFKLFLKDEIGKTGKVSNSTLEKIFEAGVTAMNVAKNKIL